MSGDDNTDGKWSENKSEGEDILGIVKCLRGRLQAERLASRNATQEAEQLRIKMLELEKQLKEEAKSRNKAEKKMKLLVNKAESMNIVQELKSPKGPWDLCLSQDTFTTKNRIEDYLSSCRSSTR